jgi:hypothetical protein
LAPPPTRAWKKLVYIRTRRGLARHLSRIGANALIGEDGPEERLPSRRRRLRIEGDGDAAGDEVLALVRAQAPGSEIDRPVGRVQEMRVGVEPLDGQDDALVASGERDHRFDPPARGRGLRVAAEVLRAGVVGAVADGGRVGLRVEMLD